MGYLMDNAERRIFLAAQCEAIEKHKWIESEKAGYDLGVFAELDWVNRFAALFRTEWASR